MSTDEELHESRTQTWGGSSEAAEIRGLPPRWRLDRKLGQGGQAEVWLAHDSELDHWVAVKVFTTRMTPPVRERLRREVRIGRELRHPGVVRIFDLVEGDGCVAAVMEWVAGGSLADEARRGPFTVHRVMEVARDTLEVLADLHKRGIIHRDVKPSNILVDERGRVRLGDLGLARRLSGPDEHEPNPSAVGTPAYMSPEQRSRHQARPASDLYGLGATLYQLLVGRPPGSSAPTGSAPNSIANGVEAAIRKHRPDCPPALAALVARMLAQEPEDRWPDAGAALDAFKRSAARRPLIPLALAAAGALLAVAGGLTWLASRPQEPAELRIHEHDVLALDGDGNESWRRSFDLQPGYVTLADVAGDEALEAVVALDGRVGPFSLRADIRVLSVDGSPIGSTRVGRGLVVDRHSRFAPQYQVPRLWTPDLDGDGRPDILWVSNHRQWYPSEVGAWRLRAGRGASPILIHSGHVHHVRAADLDGDGAEELVLAGINNVLGYQLAVAILEPLDRRTSPYPAASPDDLVSWRFVAETATDLESIRSYTLIGTFLAMPGIRSAGPEGIVLGSSQRSHQLDAFGNPVGSALEGSPPEVRRLFWNELVTLCLNLESGSARSIADIPPFIGRHAEVLAEDPMHLASVLTIARSLARANRHAAAVELMQTHGARHDDSADYWMRLGDYLAISGDRVAAGHALETATERVAHGSRAAEVANQLTRFAAYDGNQRLFRRALDRWSAALGEPADPLVDDFHALWAFFQGNWEDPVLMAPNPSSRMHEIAVIREWARYQRDGDAKATVSRAAELAEDPLVRDQADLLRAYALVGSGQAALANSIATRARIQLDRHARESLPDFIWLPIVDWTLGVIADALGDSKDAAIRSQRAAQKLPASWVAQGGKAAVAPEPAPTGTAIGDPR